MVDITKDEFLGNKYENVSKNEKRNRDSKFKKFIEEHKWMILLLASFSLLAISNGLLVYNFFRIIRKL